MTVEWQTLLFQSAVLVLLLSAHVYIIDRKMINSKEIMETLLDLQRQTDELKQMLKVNLSEIIETSVDLRIKRQTEELKQILKGDIIETSVDLRIKRQTEELKQILKDNNNRVLKEVAYGKISTQSTQHAHFDPGQANDGNVDTFSHTAMNAETSFWEVDLGRNFMIRQIQIFVRKGCCGELIRHLDILVGPSHDKLERCAFYKGPAKTGFHLVLECANIIRGQFVKIVKGVATNLALAEVKVMAFEEN